MDVDSVRPSSLLLAYSPGVSQSCSRCHAQAAVHCTGVKEQIPSPALLLAVCRACPDALTQLPHDHLSIFNLLLLTIRWLSVMTPAVERVQTSQPTT